MGSWGMAVKESLRAKSDVVTVLVSGALVIFSTELLVYFFLRQARVLMSSMNTDSGFLYTIISPLVALAEHIYIPGLIESFGVIKFLAIIVVGMAVGLAYSFRRQMIDTKRMLPEGFVYIDESEYKKHFRD
jgi:hypothetical protein